MAYKDVMEFPSLKDVTAILYNFDIGSASLKQEHKDWMFLKIVSEINKNPTKKYAVYLEGRTSRTNVTGRNQVLAEQRIASVKNYILDWKDKTVAVPEWKGWGATAAQHAIGQGAEAPVDRAVNISIVLEGAPIPPKPEPKPTSTIVTGDSFQIRPLAMISAFKVASLDQAWFQILDVAAKRVAFFSYSSSPGLAIPTPGPWLSVSKKGGFTPFWTTKKIQLWEFEGAARLAQAAGLGPISLGDTTLEFKSLLWWKSGIATNPSKVVLVTGFQWGVSAGSWSDGQLVWSPREDYPFTS